MNLLLDMRILIWALNDDSRLPDNVEFIGKELVKFCQEAGFMPLEMRDRYVFALESITRAEGASLHHDPFDRMLIAQAKAENMSFMTRDSLLP